ncbi:23231_t:CDS:2 [Entrophospora sp. SA101]|nr:2164_t:CDS:2 [Entrophospora sp. SA101]CAJ0753271.1 11840_t:CDS:2 [Entrophospora sp. SA101]CAJ0761319.1 23231_t:CDS:2 [Entrophospora sp. SA101]CAJ0910141.1 716_t:CDS:2 [Entrophospora sp. SA101]
MEKVKMNHLPLGSDQTIDFKRYYFYGFIINLLPIYIFYPIRTAKTIQQSNIGTELSTSLFEVFKERLKSEGTRGLFKGVSVYAMGSIGGRLVHFATYDALRERVGKGNAKNIGLSWLEGHSQTTINAFLGTLSAVITSSFMVPFDVISQQLQISKASSSGIDTLPTFEIVSNTTPATTSSIKTALIESSQKNFITRLKPNDVPLYRFLYRGWTAGLLNTVSFFPTYFFVYTYTLEQLRLQQQNNLYLKNILPTSHFLLSVTSGVAAGTMATFTSAPFDVVKTKIQIARKSGQGDLKWLNVANQIIKTEGMRGLFVGMSARLWIVIPLGSLNFWVFEKVKEWSTVDVAVNPDEKS